MQLMEMMATLRVLRMARSVKTIGTHDGAFHCDEAMGCWMLRQTERFKGGRITRTRNEEALMALDVVLDVGGVYDPEQCRFDHHQKGFDQVFGHGHTIKLSSAGLIYKHYGKEILQRIVHPLELSSDDLDSLYLKVYKGFVEALDGIDNGVRQYSKECSPRYMDSTGLSYRVGRLNPAWNETDPDITPDDQFQKAMDLCGADFTDYVTRVAKTWLPARVYVQSAMNERLTVHQSGEIVLLSTFCPWKEHLLDLEKEQNLTGTIKYCIYQDGNSGSYRIQAVPVASDSFESRRPLPSPWRALRSEELDEASGIDGCVFVHASGFIGGHKTKEGALQMAEKALCFPQT